MSALLSTFAITILLGVPIAFCFGLSAFAGLLAWGQVPLLILPQRMFAGVDSFPFLAIPFFILAGDMMGSTGVTLSIVRFCDALVGHVRGGLAQVNVLANVIFAGISGAATADAAALGTVLIPGMVGAGYDRSFAAALTAAAAILGPIIPPSIGMVIYSLVLGGRVSIAGLFLAGILPGLLMAGGLMLVCYVLARQRNYPVSRHRFSGYEVLRAFRGALLALLAPLIILGGILGGIFTATESAAAAVVYVLAVGFFVTRKLKPKEVLRAVERTMVTTAVVTLLLATSEVVTWLMTAMRVPELITDFFVRMSLGRVGFTILFLVLMMLAGILIEPVPLMVMFAPILAPIAYKLGFDALHFGLVFVLAVEIGLITPPVGSVLFVICGVSGTSLEVLSRAVLPFIFVELAVLIIVAFVPGFSLWIPHAMGYR